jgi:hypothetical protein
VKLPNLRRFQSSISVNEAMGFGRQRRVEIEDLIEIAAQH